MNASAQPSPIRLRSATAADLADIAEIERASFIHAGERFSDRRVGYLIRNPRSIVTVASDGNRSLGWAAGHAWLPGAKPWGRLYALAVHPDARGRQLGARLLEAMMQSLRERGAGTIFLEVRVDNHAAIRLYEKFGFAACRTLENYYGPGIAGQRMRFEKQS